MRLSASSFFKATILLLIYCIAVLYSVHVDKAEPKHHLHSTQMPEVKLISHVATVVIVDYYGRHLKMIKF